MTIALTIAAALLLIVSLLFAYVSGSCSEEYNAIMEGDITSMYQPNRPMLLKKSATHCLLIAGCAAVAAFILLVLA